MNPPHRVNCTPTGVETPLRATRGRIFHSFFILLLLRFFITFFFSTDIGPAPRTVCPLHNNLERRLQGNSSSHPIVHLFLTMTNICLLHHCSFFSWMIEWDDNRCRSLVAGPDGLAVRSGIGRKGLLTKENHCNSFFFFFLVHSLFQGRFCSHCTSEVPHSSSQQVQTTTGTRSPNLQSVAHYTRLAIPCRALHYSLAIVFPSQ
jgi:hypothetical protein